MNRGDKVRIERDETKYPVRGTWKDYRGKRGRFIVRNGNEYGVSFAKSGNTVDAWFKRHEVTFL